MSLTTAGITDSCEPPDTGVRNQTLKKQSNIE